jgi:TPR repeat protein
MAEFSVGACHHNGFGVPANELEAMQWYFRAAQQGLAEAQYEVGLAHEKGIGWLINLETAVQWHRAAAEQGLPIAQIALGSAYERGRGVIKDPVEAYAWVGLAAKNLDARGMQEEERMAGRLTPEQLRQGRRKVMDHVKRNPALVSREIPLDEEEGDEQPVEPDKSQV